MTEINDSRRAAGLLAEILYTEIGVDLRPSEIETFINRRWERIAPLAHRVHGGEARDNTKVPPEPVMPLPEQIRQAVKRLVSAAESDVADRYLNRVPNDHRSALEREVEDLIAKVPL